ncbi:MAG TPA: GerMN domain-containing protein [Syntrophomonas sp.]|nr:GerMN domain-containing protein [Syntrophomonas sp.]
MRNIFIVILAMVLLSVCLLSGGCSKPDQTTVKEWQDLLKFPTVKNQTEPKTDSDPSQPTESKAVIPGESIQVSLYFGDANGKKLVQEDRNIVKVEGIARETLEELIKGPANVELTQVFPAGTQLLDINLKPDGLCIVDLSAEACNVSSRVQEELMVNAIAKTLGQYPTIQGIAFMVDGEKVDRIGGYVDLSAPIDPIAGS